MHFTQSSENDSTDSEVCSQYACTACKAAATSCHCKLPLEWWWWSGLQYDAAASSRRQGQSVPEQTLFVVLVRLCPVLWTHCYKPSVRVPRDSPPQTWLCTCWIACTRCSPLSPCMSLWTSVWKGFRYVLQQFPCSNTCLVSYLLNENWFSLI